MTVYKKVKPTQEELAIALAAKAIKAAKSSSTARPGSVYIPNGDGTGTIIGPAGGYDSTGGANGVVPWVGDATPPGKPTGCSAASAWGAVYCKWDGTLEGGVPADFAYVSVSIGGEEKGRMAKAGTLALDGFADGEELSISFTAYDDAHDQQGNPTPNASDPAVVEITASDEKASIEAAVEEAKQSADAASDKADAMQGDIVEITATVNGIEQEVEGFSTQIEGAVEDASQALTAAAEAQQDIDGFKTTVSQTYVTKQDAAADYQPKGDYATSGELDSAIAQEVLDRNSAIEQSATEITSTVSQTYSTKTELGAVEDKAEAAQSAAESASSAASSVQGDLDGFKGTVSSTYATKTEVQQTADSIEQTVSETYQVKGDYATSGELDDAIEEEVANRNSAISQSATQIQQTVSQTYLSKEDASADYQPKGSYATTAQLTQTAESINATVSEVSQTAEGAMEKATQVEQTADGLTITLTNTTTTANNALSKANSAAAAASNAQSSADDAAEAASAAQSTANTANSNASTAKSNAQTALNAANTAKSTADDAADDAASALSTANTANSNASTAKTNAQTALNTANTARTEAANAAKTATNFLKFDSEGLCVGNQSGTLGSNALMASGKIALRDGESELVTISPSQIDLGKNSADSSILMCGGKFQVTTDLSQGAVGVGLGAIGDDGNYATVSLFTTSGLYPERIPIIRLSDLNGIYINAGQEAVNVVAEKGMIVNDVNVAERLAARALGASSLKCTRANTWARGTMASMEQTLNYSSEAKFSISNGAIVLPKDGMYLITARCLVQLCIDGDLCHLGLVDPNGNARVDEQVKVNGDWDSINATAVIHLEHPATTLYPAYKCEQGAGSQAESLIFGFVYLGPV